jgi:hypothetical protein
LAAEIAQAMFSVLRKMNPRQPDYEIRQSTVETRHVKDEKHRLRDFGAHTPENR